MDQKRVTTTLTHEQQVQLLAQYPLTEVLTEQQMRHLQWRKKIYGETAAPHLTPSALVHAVHVDGALTHMFAVSTLAKQWYWHCYIHPDTARYNKATNTSANAPAAACFVCCQRLHQTEGLLGELHFDRTELSELVVMHELIHGACYLGRILRPDEVKTIAAPYVRKNHSPMAQREEIACRTVEMGLKEITIALRTLGIDCTPIHAANA